MLAAAALIAFPGCAEMEEAASDASNSGGTKVGRVGDTVKNAGTSYKVTKVRTTKTLG